MDQTCSTCRYWVKGSGFAPHGHGECHRNPPVPFPISDASGNVVGAGAMFPPVNGNSSCGEWKIPLVKINVGDN